MGMSGMYGQAIDAEGEATIKLAIDRGITFIDTGDFYGMGHNEMLVGRAIKGQRDKVELSVKFGALRGPDGSWVGFDARPAAVKTWCAYSLKRLGVDVIDVYRPARLDPNVPIEDTIGAIADLIKAGYVKRVGLSEVGVDTITRAHAVSPVADLQIEYSIASRKPEEKIFPALAKANIGATLYGIFSRGLLTGSKPAAANRGDFRAYLPRFQGDKNASIVDKFRAFAGDHEMTPAQLCVAWVIAKQPRLMPLVGARTRAQLEDSLGALDKPLSPSDVAALEALLPPSAIAGTRYGEDQMKHLDSER
jgi:aryl-alcohol dehydrogenase-like predicted oxidoreductase